jgi:hypothetical protein
MKTKVYCIVGREDCEIKGVYTQFEVALRMSKAYSGVEEKRYDIRTIDYNHIDFGVLDVYARGDRLSAGLLQSSGE